VNKQIEYEVMLTIVKYMEVQMQIAGA